MRVKCTIHGWVSDEPQPGLVEASFVDASGAEYRFIDKAPIFSATTLSANSGYPVEGAIRCRQTGVRKLPEGDAIQISTDVPDGVRSVTGACEFLVAADQVLRDA